MLFFLLLVTTLCTPANVSGDPDVLSSLKVIKQFCCGLIIGCWVIDLKNHTLHGMWLEAQSTWFKPVGLYSHIHHHHSCTHQSIICSVKHTHRKTHAQKNACQLVADLFTQPCSLTPDLQPESSSCADAGGWGCCQAGATWGGGVSSHHRPSPPHQTGAHLEKRRGVTEGWPWSYSQSVSMKQNGYLFVYAMQDYVTTICSDH